MLSQGDKAQLRATSLFVIRSIVKKYGRTVDIDLETETINIDVPDENRVACAQEIADQVGAR